MNDVDGIGSLGQIAKGLSRFLQVPVSESKGSKNPHIGFNGQQIPGCYQLEFNIAE